MNGTTLFMGLLTGTIGTGFFIYGKKQQKMVPLFCGIVLCIVPYVFDSTPLLIGVSVILCAMPFVVKGGDF